jgi:HD-like signal output (HDOD) protein/CheY-like chemotaxis protein
MKKRVLFVDDQRSVIEDLRKMMQNTRQEWEIAFAQSGHEALEILRGNGFDMVVSDLQMPHMDGCQLLTKVQELYPNVVRIALFGFADREMILKSIRVAHQFLVKPCDALALQTTLERAFALRDFLVNEALIRVVSRVEILPSVPSIYQEIMQELSSHNASIHKVGEIISKDVGMTAKILQLANSAYFGLFHHVSNIERALTLLGFDTVTALVLTMQIFSTHGNLTVPGFSIRTLWTHSMKTAFIARAIAVKESQERSAIQDAFMGGVLHDVGKLILAANLSESYRRAITLASDMNCPFWKAEQEVFGTSHAEVGAYLMGLWGLPDPIVEAIAFHHCPSVCPARNYSPLTAVHVGNALAHSGDPCDPKKTMDLLNLDYLTRLRISDRLSVWETACKGHLQQGEVDG